MHDRNNLYPCPWNSKAVLKDLSSLVFSTVLFNCLQHVLKSAGPAELRLWTWLPHLQDWRMLEPALYLNLVSHPRHHPSSLHQLLINLVVVERWFYGSYIPVASHSQTPPQESPVCEATCGQLSYHLDGDFLSIGFGLCSVDAGKPSPS